MKKLFPIVALLTQGAASQLQATGDVTGPGNSIIGGQMIGGVFVPATEGTPAGNANMYPADGKPSFTIDNNLSTKYRNFGELNTGFVVTVSLTLVTRLDLGTANNAPERDPLTFTLEGTTGDPLTGIYTLIASGSTGFENDPWRQTGVISSTFPAVGAFTSYRLIFPTVRNSATADSMQIGEVALSGVAAPEPSILSLLGISALGLSGARRKRLAAV